MVDGDVNVLVQLCNHGFMLITYIINVGGVDMCNHVIMGS